MSWDVRLCLNSSHERAFNTFWDPVCVRERKDERRKRYEKDGESSNSYQNKETQKTGKPEIENYETKTLTKERINGKNYD